MKKSWLLWLLLVPHLMYASFFMRDYPFFLEKIGKEWKKHEELVQQFNQLGPEQKVQGLHLLQQSIECCQKAVAHCDYILKKISRKPKSERREQYWVNAVNQTTQDKNNINNEIQMIQNGINSTLQDHAFKQAIPLYQESEKRGALARQMNWECSLLLNQSETMVSTLMTVAQHYDDAIPLAERALGLIAKYQDETSKDALRQLIEACRVGSERCKKEASEWPDAFPIYQNVLKEWVSLLKVETDRLAHDGQKQVVYDLQKKMAYILEVLVESGTGEEFQEELGSLKASIADYEKDGAQSPDGST